MIFEILWCENKTADWKVCTVKEAIAGGEEYTDVSINRKDKSGAVAFPKFDEIAPAFTLEAEYWSNPAGKQYLFAPKPAPKNDEEVIARNTAPTTYVPVKKSFGGASAAMETKKNNIAEAQDRTFTHVKESQENKNLAIRVSQTMRDATQICIALFGNDSNMTGAEFQENFSEIKKWYLKQWDEAEKLLDLPL